MIFYLLDHHLSRNIPRTPGAGRPWYETRHKPISLIVIHTAENLPDFDPPDMGAEAVARYGADTERASWHVTTDSDSTIPMLPDTYTALHVRGYSSQSLGLEIATRASQWVNTPYDWRIKVLDRAAEVIADWCRKWDIPVRLLTRAEVDAGERGITFHSRLDPTRRSDPGKSFPWPYVERKVKELLGQASPPVVSTPAPTLELEPSNCKSVFVQVSTYPTDELAQDLDQAADDPTIRNIVLDEIGTDRLHPNMLTVLPRLHGFDNVFVGSHFIRWYGTGSHYRDGIQNKAHRWANLNTQKKLWAEFASKYSGVWHGYVQHEAVLDWFDEPAVRQAYDAYLIQSRRDLDEINPGRSLLWSPAVWALRPFNDAEAQAIQNLFANVALHAPPGIDWLHLQDMQGRATPPKLEIVKAWMRALDEAYPFRSLRVNMELFVTTPDGIRAADPAEVSKRSNWYAANDIPVGTSFELRYLIG